MSTRPVDVPDIQGSLVKAMHTTEFRKQAAVILSLTDPAWTKEDPIGVGIDELMDFERTRMAAAHSFHCSEDMTAMCLAASDSLLNTPATLSFEPETLPTELGFVVFDKPAITVTSINENAESQIAAMRLPIEAISWGPARGSFRDDPDLPPIAGIRFTYYSRMDYVRDWVVTEAERRQDLERMERVKAGRLPNSWLPVDTLMWMRGPRTLPAMSDMPVENHQPAAQLALMWTFFNFCSQTITTKDREAVPPKVARRWKKMKFPPRVVVVKLRRASSHVQREGEGHVEWQHRWIVRGHWRKQACGVGRAERRPVWISAHVKGPDDKPLHISEKVYDLSR
jgi:hypothetical protein